MTEAVAVPEVLTRDVVLGWTGAEMLRHMKDPTKRSEIERIFNTPEPDPVAEAAAEEQKRIADAAVEEARIQAEAAAAAQVEAAAVKAAEEAAKTPVYKKLVVEYQATDPATGNRIGRPTHLECQYIDGDKDSLIAAYQEMSEKQRIAHVNATQALENIKRRKPTFVEEQPVQVGMTEEEVIKLAGELDEDPAKTRVKVDAVRKLTKVDEAIQEAQLAKADAEATKQSFLFMQAHVTDFFPCQANSDVLTAYLKENNLEWTKDNLEIAFASEELKLAEKPVEIVPEAPQPPAPVVQAQPVAAVEIPAAPSVVAAPAVVPSAEPANPALQPRRVPNGGLQPGQMSGRPPVQAAATGLTKRDVLKMPRDEYKQRIKNPKFRAEVNALFAAEASA